MIVCPFRVGSEHLKNLEADLPADYTAPLFIKSPRSTLAEIKTVRLVL